MKLNVSPCICTVIHIYMYTCVCRYMCAYIHIHIYAYLQYTMIPKVLIYKVRQDLHHSQYSIAHQSRFQRPGHGRRHRCLRAAEPGRTSVKCVALYVVVLKGFYK